MFGVPQLLVGKGNGPGPVHALGFVGDMGCGDWTVVPEVKLSLVCDRGMATRGLAMTICGSRGERGVCCRGKETIGVPIA